MKQPFWIVNSILLVLLLLAFGFMFFTQQQIPARANFEPDPVELPKKDVSKIDLTKIYANDLFDTYQPALPPPPPIEEIPAPTAVPMPPKPTSIDVHQAPKTPLFREPLKVTLRGIIIARDDAENIAILEDTGTTKQTSNYRVGQQIEDAELIRILKNKVIFVRSNGQQETLYISQKEAEKDQRVLSPSTWGAIVQAKGPTHYLLDPKAFLGYIPSLAQFIDAFNLITAYNKGENIGVKIGSLPDTSLPRALGLQAGDIITTINSISTQTTDDKFEIYKKIVAMQENDIIEVAITRNNSSLVLTYSLTNLTTEIEPSLVITNTAKPAEQIIPADIFGKQKSPEQLEAEKIKLLHERKKFAPTLDEIKLKEKELMLEKGSRRNKNVLYNSVGGTDEKN